MWKLKQIFDGEEKTFEANEDWIAAIEKLSANPLMKIIISKPMAKDCQYKKIVVEKKGDGYQAAKYTEKQVFHDNFGAEDLQGYLMEAIHDTFLQVNAWDEKKEYSLLISKKGAVTLRAKASKEAPDTVTEHNRKKNYILDEGQVIPPLVDMGIFTGEGKVVKSMYDKFRQINRFIEMVDDVLKSYKGDEINIIDFGCGKSYLTFFLYYYVVEIRHMTAHITGLDLKEQVIKNCNKLAEKCGYTDLKFEIGDINGYRTDRKVDMVVTLHACDTATDYALYNAICWNTTYILSVPCCQHELNKQIRSEELSALTKYGIIKERTAALMTDAIRGCVLEYCGYKTDLLEFIDIEHSPKNILIRAVKKPVSEEKRERAKEEADRLCRTFGIRQTLMQLVMTEERSHS